MINVLLESLDDVTRRLVSSRGSGTCHLPNQHEELTHRRQVENGGNGKKRTDENEQDATRTNAEKRAREDVH